MLSKSKLLSLALALSLPICGHAQTLNTQSFNASKFTGRLSDLKINALSKGGGIDGGGGDGLEMQPADSKLLKGTINLPVPGSVENSANKGYLRIDGTPSAPRSDREVDPSVFALSCYTNGAGVVLVHGCFNYGEIRINQSTPLVAGTYFLQYNNTFAVVKVEVDKTTLVSLTKLQVPKAKNPAKITFFSDYTAKSEQEREAFASYVWQFWHTEHRTLGQGTYETSIAAEAEKNCIIKVSNGNRAACKAYVSGNYKSWLGPILKIDTANNTVDIWNFSDEKFDQREYGDVGTIRDGEFISVLPGIYGMTSTSTETGASDTQYGIVAE